MAVYTKVSEAQAEAYLEGYDLGAFESLTGIRQGTENSNYLLATTRGRFILTLYEKRVREEDLPFFLGLMEHCARHGVPCPLPVRMKSGELLGRLEGRPATLVSFLDGEMTLRITPDECAGLGRALATLHLAAQDFEPRRQNALALPAWEKLLGDCKPRADEVRAGLAVTLGQELDFLRGHWPKDLPRGIIHADLFPDNVFFRGSEVCGLIDFYFACEEMLAYDIAICFNAWCFERHVSFNVTKARAMINGYESVRKLDAAEKAALPVLVRGADLRFLLTRLYDWLHQVPGALVKPKDPLEYLTRLEFHRMAKGIADYGLVT
jgi:homoserine kinase type II